MGESGESGGPWSWVGEFGGSLERQKPMREDMHSKEWALNFLNRHCQLVADRFHQVGHVPTAATLMLTCDPKAAARRLEIELPPHIYGVMDSGPWVDGEPGLVIIGVAGPFDDDAKRGFATALKTVAFLGRACLSIFHSEVWMTVIDDGPEDMSYEEALAACGAHPHGRKEMIFVAMEHESGSVARYAEILHPTRGKARLGPWDTSLDSLPMGGRFANVLCPLNGPKAQQLAYLRDLLGCSTAKAAALIGMTWN